MSTLWFAIFSHTTQANKISHIEYTLQNLQYKQRDKLVYAYSRKSTHIVFFRWLKELGNFDETKMT